MSQEKYLFRCPNCFEEMIVDNEIKDELLDTGCILCGAQLREEDFQFEN